MIVFKKKQDIGLFSVYIGGQKGGGIAAKVIRIPIKNIVCFLSAASGGSDRANVVQYYPLAPLAQGQAELAIKSCNDFNYGIVLYFDPQMRSIKDYGQLL